MESTYNQWVSSIDVFLLLQIIFIKFEATHSPNYRKIDGTLFGTIT